MRGSDGAQMPFDPSILSTLEDALSDCFQYHNQLDNLLMRTGISQAQLQVIRQKAEARASQAQRQYSRAPKRYIVQETLNLLASLGSTGDPFVASLITAVTKGVFPEAGAKANEAIEILKARAQADRVEKDQQRKIDDEDRRQRENEANRKWETTYLKAQKAKDDLKDRFITLMREENAQSRGYLFETFLNDLFEAEQLAPRASFRINNEQIDGSFSWQGKTYLVEAKWVQQQVAGAEFGAFDYKMSGRTLDTRGVFISVNGYSPAAIQGLNSKGALRFVCLDGAHISRSLEPGQSLSKLLSTVWRHADETGEAYLSVSAFKHL
jgi:hypothetical protein